MSISIQRSDEQKVSFVVFFRRPDLRLVSTRSFGVPVGGACFFLWLHLKATGAKVRPPSPTEPPLIIFVIADFHPHYPWSLRAFLGRMA